MRKLCSCNIKWPNFQTLSKDKFLGLQEDLLASTTLKTRAGITGIKSPLGAGHGD